MHSRGSRSAATSRRAAPEHERDHAGRAAPDRGRPIRGARRLTQLRLAFERYLVGKVQLEELRRLNEAGTDTLLKMVSEYRDMEGRYIDGVIAKRAARAADKRDGAQR
jgi:hypothetical protein